MCNPSKRRIAALAALLVFACGPALSQDVPTLPEQFYHDRFCAGFDVEVRLGRHRRADCITQTHAIEVEWHDEWKEGVGRALAHSAATGLLPGIVLVCRSDQGHCLKSSLLTRQALSHHGVRATVWDCLPIDRSLDECARWDL